MLTNNSTSPFLGLTVVFIVLVYPSNTFDTIVKSLMYEGYSYFNLRCWIKASRDVQALPP